GEQVEHHGADGAGRPDNGEGRPAAGNSAHRPVPPYTTASTSSASRSNARGAEFTATSTSLWLTPPEIRVSDVGVIWMFTPASASAPKNFALTPGCERMPAPISETLPILSS